MRKFHCHAIRVAVVSAAVLLCAVGSFFLGFEYRARDLVRQYRLENGCGNAIKHSYAAAQTYHFLRKMGASKQSGAQKTAQLGLVNEYAEQVVKLRKPDDSIEVAKDLYNNEVGVATAIMQENVASLQPEELGRVLAMLCKRHVLMASASDKQAIPPAIVTIAAAFEWSQNQKRSLKKKLRNALQKAAQPETLAIP